MNYKFVLIVLLFFIYNSLPAQEEKFCFGGRLIFYNTERLFDLKDDAGPADRDFLKGGKLNWDEEKYSEKIAHIGKVLAAVADTANPLLIGLSEIENRKVLEDLVACPALKPYGFKYIHQEPAGSSGTEPALLYRPDCFVPEYDLRLRAEEKEISGKESGEILYVKGFFNEEMAVYVFVNQWPEGAGSQSVAGRKKLAGLLQSKLRDIRTGSPYARMIVMGDFNENPDAGLLKDSLQLSMDATDTKAALVSVMPAGPNEKIYSGKENGRPVLYDQIMMSGNLLEPQYKWGLKNRELGIYKAAWLMDSNGMPFSTFEGRKYRNGYSDRLPVWADFFFRP